MNAKKMTPDQIRFFFGVDPTKLTKELPKERQASLLDNHLLAFEGDYNSEDFKKIINAIYEREEIDVDVKEFKDNPVSVRIDNFQKVHKTGSDLWHCKFNLILVRRLADLTQQEIEVIDERIQYIIDMLDPADPKDIRKGRVTVMLKEMAFNFSNGYDASIELVNEHFYEIAEKYQLGDVELIELASYVSQREKEIQLKDESEISIFNEHTEINHQYINDARRSNRLKTKTNGGEHLRL